MSPRIGGQITIDVYDYNDELEIHADCEDIVEIMDFNQITAGEMIDYLRENKYPIGIDDVFIWLEGCDATEIIAVAKKCISMIKSVYTEAENGRVEYRDKLVDANSRMLKMEAEQKVITGGPHVREV